VTTWRRAEEHKRTVRFEFEAPVDAKVLGFALHLVATEFKALNGREATYDNDYWLEPTDEGVAFVFEVVDRISDDKEETVP
jgi:hypothetical protein